MADHDAFMREALAEARKGFAAGEVPVGAVIVVNDRIVGRGFNQPVCRTDPTAHAEVVALREAAASLANYRVLDSTLYVTIEPCLMCVGAIVHARVATVVFGAAEPKAGAVVSTMRGFEHSALNHRVAVVEGVLAEDCRAIIQDFFKQRRQGV
jgi:tRNA(adenine34) deaminase